MNSIDLNGRRAIVTGGAQGLGRAIAERLQVSGAGVYIWDFDHAAMTEAQADWPDGGPAGWIEVDVSDPDAVEAALHENRKSAGTIDILVNNAGISGPNMSTWEYGIEDWRRVIDIDLTGPFLVSRTVVPLMREAGYGRIVNIASVAGKEGNPNASAYSAAKAGLIALTKSLGKELAGSGVLVNCVTPAAVETRIFAQMSQTHIDFMLSKIPLARFGLPQEIAAMVAWLCSEDCSFSTGAVFDLSGGRATY
jgi:NAD(P)-dependent dehydrogenase (short-subunit alcohol dehydrogenase family)